MASSSCPSAPLASRTLVPRLLPVSSNETGQENMVRKSHRHKGQRKMRGKRTRGWHPELHKGAIVTESSLLHAPSPQHWAERTPVGDFGQLQTQDGEEPLDPSLFFRLKCRTWGTGFIEQNFNLKYNRWVYERFAFIGLLQIIWSTRFSIVLY